ncbi:hypothetical protein MTR67_051199 [Solanum verrucosum]|uniref:Uncharacterized protein n=1 Tax=Solanum verrucosum TaxID=315347 RepID=A0AAF1A2J3_SOLVR|nr:hypothetical protein MTR67_051199 [Solanum verrucosum]
MISSIKFFTILLCFLVAFLCNVQSVRYYAHVSFLATVVNQATVRTFKERSDSIEYVARNLNRGSMFRSLGLRAFYLSLNFLSSFGYLVPYQCL